MSCCPKSAPRVVADEDVPRTRSPRGILGVARSLGMMMDLLMRMMMGDPVKLYSQQSVRGKHTRLRQNRKPAILRSDPFLWCKTTPQPNENEKNPILRRCQVTRKPLSRSKSPKWCQPHLIPHECSLLFGWSIISRACQGLISKPEAKINNSLEVMRVLEDPKDLSAPRQLTGTSLAFMEAVLCQ